MTSKQKPETYDLGCRNINTGDYQCYILEHCSIISTSSVQRETFLNIIPNMTVDIQLNSILFFFFSVAKIVEYSHCKIDLSLAFGLSPEGVNFFKRLFSMSFHEVCDIFCSF